MLTSRSCSGVALEDMDRLFSRPTHLVVWAQLRGKPLVDASEDNFGSGSRRDSLKKAEEAVVQVP